MTASRLLNLKQCCYITSGIISGALLVPAIGLEDFLEVVTSGIINGCCTGRSCRMLLTNMRRFPRGLCINLERLFSLS